MKSANLPDVVGGRLLVTPSPLDLRVLNALGHWLQLRAEVVAEGGSAFTASGASASVWLAPGAMAQLPVPLTLQGPSTDREAPGCAALELRVYEGQALRSVARTALRCRRSDQSALFSYAARTQRKAESSTACWEVLVDGNHW